MNKDKKTISYKKINTFNLSILENDHRYCNNIVYIKTFVPMETMPIN